MIVNLATDEAARSSAMTGCTILDLIVILVFSPQIDRRDWTTQVICFTFLLRNFNKVDDNNVNKMYFAFVIISIMPMVLASLAKDIFKASGMVFHIVGTLKVEKIERDPEKGLHGEIVECSEVKAEKFSVNLEMSADSESGPQETRQVQEEEQDIAEEPSGQIQQETIQTLKSQEG
eukprot:767259-Hanusia_phi.AAC.7